MLQSSYELAVLVKNRPITEYYHNCNHYVEGRQGSEFTLRLVNHTGRRALMVPAVDGLSVLDGKPAGDASGGYIVDSTSTLDIPGWTLDNQQVARFFFADKKKSYAAVHPDHPSAANAGVIGCRVYEEKISLAPKYMATPQPPLMPPIQPWQPWNNPWGKLTLDENIYRCSGTAYQLSSNAAIGSATCSAEPTAASKPAAAFNLGTGFGTATNFQTTTVNFERGPLAATLVIYYDTKDGLRKQGVPLPTVTVQKPQPNPFPGGGCKPPIGYAATAQK